jgi:hypothetical protein
LENWGLVCDRCHNPCSLFVAEKRDFRERAAARVITIFAQAIAAITIKLPQWFEASAAPRRQGPLFYGAGA